MKFYLSDVYKKQGLFYKYVSNSSIKAQVWCLLSKRFEVYEKCFENKRW